jgi:hypothetical protein
MSLTAEQIAKNYEKHLKIIEHYIVDRGDQVKTMLNDLEDTYVMAPASGKSWYHNAFAGGYVDHVNRVVEYSIKQMRLYEEMGGTIDFTQEELVFSALFHDLGKIGDKDNASYIPQTDKWRQDKLHEMYTPNGELDFMLVPDRSLFTLQEYGIKTTKNEYLAIKLHDGVFSDANKPYFFSNQPNARMKTSIVNILHSADFLASKVEYDKWLAAGGSTTPKTQKTKSSTGKRVNSSEGLTNMLKNL